MKISCALTVARIGLLLGAAITAQAAQGAPFDFDPAFGTAGNSQVDLGGASAGNLAVTTDKSGNVYALSGSNSSSINTITRRRAGNGALDTGFGNAGILSFQPANPGPPPIFCSLGFSCGSGVRGICIDPASGDIITVGSEMSAARYTAAGVLDTSFGTNGVVSPPLPANQGAFAFACAFQPDGKILLLGTVISSDGASEKAAVARLTSSGAVDSGFGSSGLLLYNSTGNMADVATCASVAPDATIYVGSVSVPVYSEQSQAVVARLSSAGGLDTGFGGNGFVVADSGTSYRTIGAVNAAANGGVLAVVASNFTERGINGGEPIVAFDGSINSYRADGTLDTAYGLGGRQTGRVSLPQGVSMTNPNGGANAVLAMALDPDGRILLGGSGPAASGSDTVESVLRLDGAQELGQHAAGTGSSGGGAFALFPALILSIATVLRRRAAWSPGAWRGRRACRK